MKKIVALIITGVMLIASATSVFAESDVKNTMVKGEAEIESSSAEELGKTPENAAAINWSDYKEFVASPEGVKGEFVTCKSYPVKFYLPEGFEAVDLDQEDIDDGFYLMYMYFDDEIEEPFSVALMYYDFDYESLEEYAEFLKDAFDVETVEYDVINGYQAISYSYPDDEATGYVAFITEEGHIIELVLEPVNEEGYAAYSATIVFSFMGANDEE